MSIRRATVDDIPVIADGAARFVSQSPFAPFAQFSKDAFTPVARWLIEGESSVAFVAEVNGEVVGAIVGMLAPLWFSPSVILGSEIGWWVNEEHRGSTVGGRLLIAFERWATERGASAVTLSDLIVSDANSGVRGLDLMMQRARYTMAERCYLKEV
ncbi:MAG: GNAT family N-acetyltransferase [Burkholderiales bacterium]|jgi:GNAT superfamily N-acetyltransferase|nr:GNAT family N-acetyltransferase [Burkholderiales bacterium]